MAIDKDGAGGLDRKTADELLYRSLRSVYHFERGLVERFGLGYQEIYLLQLLRRRESARIGEIASALGAKVFSTTRLVQRLEVLGYVGKERDEGDRRGVSVRLLPAGGRLVGEIEAHNFGRIVGAASALSADEQSAFVLVARNLDRVLGVEDRVDLDPA
ncbi:MAG: MarR family transcriptional regulator [Spirochaetes bacterium]|nr:MarR family transcriptional regulator [Spirochaetota bacterium]MBU1081188.1 MarR family transcriptional regulator [Spirochaetota bacterium]